MGSSSICLHAAYSQMHLRQRASSIQGAKYTKCIKNVLGLLWKLCPCWLLRHVQALGYLVLWNWCILVVRRFPASHFPPWVDSSLSAAVSHTQSYSNLIWHDHRWICNKELHQASNDTKYAKTLSAWPSMRTVVKSDIQYSGDFLFWVALCSCFTPTIK